MDGSTYKYPVTGMEVGIKAKSDPLMLNDVVKVRVCFTLTGALSYVNSKLVSSTAAETEKNIAKALYAYWQAAENYLG